MNELSGKVAVVTGASRGLGRAVVIAVARAGADVVLVARDRDDLEETARVLRDDTRRRALIVPADVSVRDDVESVRVATEARFGPASILVNAAGVFGPLAIFSETDPARWVETVMVNTIGSYLTCRLFVRGMIDQGWGRIVNVSSAASLLEPNLWDSAYATSKIALNRLTRQLAAELPGTGVTANLIHPGSLKTDMWGDIRAQVGLLGETGKLFRDWVGLVESTGGDSIDAAVELVLDLLGPAADATNGTFCWPKGTLEDPLPSW
jgi:NAD(P)-dependent dehydrogenase (short-subunit alcohol dehydrogenase family)